MEKEEKSLKKELIEIKIILILSRLLKLLYTHNGIHLTGIIISSFWTGIFYFNTGSFVAAPILLVVQFCIVKFWWIPSSNLEQEQFEITEDLKTYKIEQIILREKIRETRSLNSNLK